VRKEFDMAISETTDSDDSDDTVLYRPPNKSAKHILQSYSRKQKSDNYYKSIPEAIPYKKKEQQTTRKRKLEPKENSEELPEKRLIKLQKLNLKHNFIIDPKIPLKKLFCITCEESILSYRWSIITDHLKSQKHKEYSLNMQNQELTDVQIFTAMDNNNHPIILSTEGKLLAPMESDEMCHQFILNQLSTEFIGTNTKQIDSQQISLEDPAVNGI